MPAVLVLLVFSCDFAMTWAHDTVAIGVLDEPAHLATAGTVLLAVCGWSTLALHPREVLVVLVSAVLIDVDHVPLYLGLDRIAPAGRPVSHSLATVVVFLVVAVLVAPRWSRWPLAVACGVSLHLVRDLATGPGISLFWPLTDRAALVPYVFYAGVFVGLGAVATIHCRTAAQPIA
jgi:inner membrane protein